MNWHITYHRSIWQIGSLIIGNVPMIVYKESMNITNKMINIIQSKQNQLICQCCIMSVDRSHDNTSKS